MKRIIIIISIIAAILICLSGFTIYKFHTTTYDNEPVRVFIPANSSVQAVQDSLISTLGKRFGTPLFYLWKFTGGTPEKSHGSYVIDPQTSILKASQTIRKGQQSPLRITIHNARTYSDLLNQISTKLEATPEQIDQELQSKLESHPQLNNTPAHYTAAILPDTYDFFWTAQPATIIRKLVSHRDNFWNEDRLNKASQLGLSPLQVTIIASIVEEESNKSDERPKIARLYINRLKKGMKLQADPTVKFAIQDFTIRRITAQHLKTDSPYNTYLVTGLPPGPIRVAQAKTIDQVLNAPNHDYIYMCAKEDFSGYHNFASDYNTHLQNARKYHAALNKRGIH